MASLSLRGCCLGIPKRLTRISHYSSRVTQHSRSTQHISSPSTKIFKMHLTTDTAPSTIRTPSNITPFNPALLVIDVQNDFALPNGALSVPNGEEVVEPINDLLKLPFMLKIATKDWHPKRHISFASTHKGAEPYKTMVTVKNPKNPSERYETLAWPDHCVQGTKGAELHKDLDTKRIDKVIEKGQMMETEMYSAFYPPLSEPRVGDSGLADVLRAAGITDVFCVGLAADYCVGSTAEDASKEGFRSWIIEEATRAVMTDQWEKVKSAARGLGRPGVGLIHINGAEVGKVRAITKEGLKILTSRKVEGDRGLNVGELPCAK